MPLEPVLSLLGEPLMLSEQQFSKKKLCYIFCSLYSPIKDGTRQQQLSSNRERLLDLEPWWLLLFSSLSLSLRCVIGSQAHSCRKGLQELASRLAVK